MTILRLTLCAAILLAGAAPALARKEPCSGKKGGVSHCESGKFVCKDGTRSSSKQICSR